MEQVFSQAARPRAERVRAAPTRKTPDLRWQLLDDLTAAREEVGLKDRTLQVLRALLSFLPSGERRSLVVFPSNRTLSQRLLGMPESTLRRHLAILCETGLIARRNSPNRKRYRVGRSEDLTFGLDLAPFFGAASRIRELADEAAAEYARRKDLRARILDRLASICADHPMQAPTRQMLRRKLDAEALNHILASLPLPPETTVDDTEIERHIQSQNTLQKTPETIAHDALEEIADLTNTNLRSQADIEEAGEKASHAIGTHTAWTIAKHRHGPAWATMALAHIHRRLPRIREPDRYLAALTHRASQGRFDLIAALASP